jgi:hypothetical protein
MRQKLLLIERCKFVFVKSGKSIFHHVTRFFNLVEITRHKTALKKENEILRNGIIWIGAGLLAISLIILQGLLTLSTLDFARTAALICFSLSIPLLASVLAIFNFEIIFKKRSFPMFGTAPLTGERAQRDFPRAPSWTLRRTRIRQWLGPGTASSLRLDPGSRSHLVP